MEMTQKASELDPHPVVPQPVPWCEAIVPMLANAGSSTNE
jgi:hypothetical protein